MNKAGGDATRGVKQTAGHRAHLAMKSSLIFIRMLKVGSTVDLAVQKVNP